MYNKSMKRPDKAALLVRMMGKRSKEDFMHSSGYARMQSGGGLGATSTESFARRQATHKNRSRVQAYSDSKLMMENRSGQRVKGIDEQVEPAPTITNADVNGGGMTVERREQVKPQVKPDFER